MLKDPVEALLWQDYLVASENPIQISKFFVETHKLHHVMLSLNKSVT